MTRTSQKSALLELSETEGVFTTAQAERFGISKGSLSQYARNGTVDRIVHGAYRMRGSRSTPFDELAAVWKLTAPDKLSFERMDEDSWDGVAISGTTALALREVGDFHLSPYRLLSSRRIQSRRPYARFGRRTVERAEIEYIHGLPVARVERAIADIVLDNEEPSLARRALAEALKGNFDMGLYLKIAEREPRIFTTIASCAAFSASLNRDSCSKAAEASLRGRLMPATPAMPTSLSIARPSKKRRRRS